MSPASSHLLGRFGLVLVFLLLCLPQSALARAETPAPEVMTGPAFTIIDPRITESSGLASDPDNSVFWTVNDAVDRGVVYAVGVDGRTRGTVAFNADPVDVAALAYVNGRLYIADIGDSAGVRATIRVYVINAPTPGVDRGDDFTTYTFVYPDGPQDAEAILVDDAGRLRIVTKASAGGIYVAPRPLRAGGTNRLTRVADAPAWVTDATVLPSGDFALRTYLSLEVVEPDLYATEARSVLPFQPQGESLAVSLAGDALLIGTKGAQSRVLRVRIPTTIQSEATGVPTPPPVPRPTAASVVVEPPVEGVNRTGTLVALGLAVLMAIIAGAIVLLRDPDRDQEPAPAVTPRRQQEDPGGATADTWASAPTSPVDDDPTEIRPR